MRLVSWNIHGGVGQDGRQDLSRIAALLHDTGCDAAALQEVGDPWRGVPGQVADHAAAIAHQLGWYVAYGPNLILAGRPYGNAIVSRYPIAQARNYDLSVPGHEPRGCLRADLSLPDGRSLHLFNLHLGLSAGERRRQAGMLLSADLLRDAALQAPLVVCGDFNMWWPAPGPITRLLRTTMRDAASVARSRRPTWPSRFPLLRLDRAYVDSAVRVRGCGVINDPRSRIASDHLPLWLEVDILPEAVASALATQEDGA